MRHLALALTLASLALSGAAQAADRRVELVNAARVDLREFYASNTKRSSWEEDILGRDTLSPGESVMINIDDGSGACRFDFLAVMANGSKVEKRDVNVCEISRFTVR